MLQELESELLEYNRIIDSALIVNLDNHECDYCTFSEHCHDVEKPCIDCNLIWKDEI